MKIFKFDDLFEYYDYLDNIDTVSFDEVEKVSNKLDNYIIYEGLIKTYPLQLSIDILKKRFPKFNISANDDGEIYIQGSFNKDKIKILSNTLGYIVSSEDNNLIIIVPKYDREIETLPKIIYHSTLNIYKDKIQKNGLIPKSKNKISNHPDRIYFSLNLEDAKLFKEYLQKEYNEDTCIIKISTENLNNKFYSDINFKDRGIYTLNNISKNNIIEIIKK